MSTITPNSDSTQLANQSSPAVGALVQNIATGLAGRVIAINFEGNPTQIFVQWVDNTLGAISVLEVGYL